MDPLGGSRKNVLLGLSRTGSSGSSVVSFKAPRYSPFTDLSSAASSPRRFTPSGKHAFSKVDSDAPTFRPVTRLTPLSSGDGTPVSSVAPLSFDNWRLSGFTTTPELSRTGSAPSGRESALSGRSSALASVLMDQDSVGSAGALSRTHSASSVASRTRSAEGALPRTLSSESSGALPPRRAAESVFLSAGAGSGAASPRLSRTGSASSMSSIGSREYRSLMDLQLVPS